MCSMLISASLISPFTFVRYFIIIGNNFDIACFYSNSIYNVLKNKHLPFELDFLAALTPLWLERCLKLRTASFVYYSKVIFYIIPYLHPCCHMSRFLWFTRNVSWNYCVGRQMSRFFTVCQLF